MKAASVGHVSSVAPSTPCQPFEACRIPDYTLSALKLYVEQRIGTGGFLRAVLENNLAESIGRADANNLAALPAIVGYVYNEMPSTCWGSREKVAKWLNPAERGQ